MAKRHKRSLLSLAFCCTLLTLFPKSLLAVHSITPTQPITDNQTIASLGQKFELGFFLPANSTSKYLGIWYKNIPDKNVVWVANRDIPLENSTGILTFGNEGNLVLLNREGSILWSSNLSKPAKNPVAQLLDDGNFVLKDESSEEYLWQSFDYPSDTLLPGMKLGWDMETGFNRYLMSWASNNDPSSGQYTYNVEPLGLPQMVLHQGNAKIFRTGPWNGQQFSGEPVLVENTNFKPTFVSNSSHVYYSYEIVDNITSRLVLGPNGHVQHFSWNARYSSWNLLFTVQGDRCDNYGICGSFGSCNIDNFPICQCLKGFRPESPEDWDRFDRSGGCVRKDEKICGNGEWFKKYEGIKLPDASEFSVNLSLSLEDCGHECLRNCSCLAYAKLDINGNGTGCVTWYGDLIDIRDLSENGQELYIRLAASELVSDSNVDANKKQKPLALAVALPVASAFLILVSVTFFVISTLRRKGAREQDNEVGGARDYSQETELELPLFDMAVIEAATNNFSFANKVGEGGFGPVYKGELPSGQIVAVKRLSENSGQGIEEFKNEVILISQLQHRNLVKLLGCCIQGEERMLIYEYMHNRSLDSLIFETRSCSLSWQKRYDIVVGIARGLLYLHRDSRLRIIHRDLKASNVLLDGDMNPKISDFGMARTFGGDQTEAKTKRVVGTYGYMSPEYAMDGQFSVKSDVFSFGVLVLEVISGKKNKGFYYLNEELNLLGHAWKLWKEGNGMKLLDSSVGDSYSASEVLRCIKVALLCVQERAEDRPTMSNVVLMLSSETATMPEPKTPGFCIGRNHVETDSSSSKQDESVTVNQVTVTILDPR